MFSSSDPEKAPHDLAEKSVKELQSMAVDVDLTAPQRRAPILSRAGQLHLIDDLSRTAGAGLGVAAGLCVFLAVTIGRDLPVRAGAWLVIVGAALAAVGGVATIGELTEVVLTNGLGLTSARTSLRYIPNIAACHSSKEGSCARNCAR